MPPAFPPHLFELLSALVGAQGEGKESSWPRLIDNDPIFIELSFMRKGGT